MTNSSTDPKQNNLTFMQAFKESIKLINPSFTDIPQYHLDFINLLDQDKKFSYVQCHRGFGKTFLSVEMLIFHLAMHREIPNSGLGTLSSMVVIGDCQPYCTNIKRCMKEHYELSEYLQQHLPVAKFSDGYIEFTNAIGDKFGVRIMGINESPRGVKIFNERPGLVILDDTFDSVDNYVKDQDKQNKIVTDKLKEVRNLVNPSNSKVFCIGTTVPNILSAMNWEQFPVAKEFPCEQENFKGNWASRFTHKNLTEDYKAYMHRGTENTFLTEMMLKSIFVGASEIPSRMCPFTGSRLQSRQSVLYSLLQFCIAQKKSDMEDKNIPDLEELWDTEINRLHERIARC